MFKHFNKYYDEVRNIDWSSVLQEEDPDFALDVFTNLN